MEEFTLGKQMFKVLSSDMRIRILKELAGKQKTQTDLAELLKVKIPTVKEHLVKLEEEGLVRKDEERKWKYYSLTERGRTLLAPEPILVKLAIFSFIGLAVLSFLRIFSRLRAKSVVTLGAEVQQVEFAASPAREVVAASSLLDPLTITLLALTLLMFVVYLFAKKAKRF